MPQPPPNGLPPLNKNAEYSDGVRRIWASQDPDEALVLVDGRFYSKGPVEFLAMAEVAGAKPEVWALVTKLQHLLSERDNDNGQAHNGQVDPTAPDSASEPVLQEQRLPPQQATPPRINGPLLSENDKEVRRFVYYYRQNYDNWPAFRSFLNGWLQNKGHADPDAEGMMPLRRKIGSRVKDCEERKVLGRRTEDDRVTLPAPEDDIYFGQDWL